MLTAALATLVALSGIGLFVLQLRLDRLNGEILLLAAKLRRAEARAAQLARFEVVADAEDRARQILADAAEEAQGLVSEASRQSETLRAGAAEVVAQAEAQARSLVVDAESAAMQNKERSDSDAKRLFSQAFGEAEALRLESATVLAAARVESREIVEKARVRAQTIEAEASAMLSQAEVRVKDLLADAERRALEVAGDALRAVQEAKTLERTAQALRNIVEGYGDRYLIPAHSLTDDLAEDFGHTEAGQRLKAVRELIRDALRREQAATCDYVEANRRETAVRFVTDAFNGKADTALARVKHDNVGTLRAEIEDAAVVVNHNGAAFRNARILPPYVSLRIDELTWAATVQELKLAEKEEQRRIKEQIREEDRARREFERAMKESAKEEDIVRRAMEKATTQLAKASEEQRAKYEEQLAELGERLKMAEEKNQRALSMAQQTKRGHVYVISNVGSFGEHVYKIGLTRRLEPLDRIRELGDSSVPFEFDVHAMLWSEDAPALENQLHKHFVMSQINKVNHRKEFFRVDLSHVRKEIDDLGLTAHWTMAASAREYRETQAIESLIAGDPSAREQWKRRQLELDPVSWEPIAVVGAGADSDEEE